MIAVLLPAGQGARPGGGLLDDGTMVVAERREGIGAEVAIRVTSVLTTANGRMVFGQALARTETPNGSRPALNTEADSLR